MRDSKFTPQFNPNYIGGTQRPTRKVAGSLWISWHHLKHRRGYAAFKAHRRYGPIVRIGPNEICFSSPKAYREIYQNETNLQKTEFYDSRTPTGIQNIFSMRNRQAHNGRRKLEARAYFQASMLSLTVEISASAKQLTDSICQRGTGGTKVGLLLWSFIYTKKIFIHMLLVLKLAPLKAGILTGS